MIDNAGRSRAFINGSAATAAQLRELGEMLVDIHGQHAHQSLLRDRSAARCCWIARPACSRRRRRLRRPGASWQARGARSAKNSKRNAKNVLQERERLEWQVGELDKLALQARRMGRDQQ